MTRDEILKALIEALETYADEAFYHGCAFLFDRPTGGFDEDFDQSEDSEYDYPKPGKLARETLRRVAPFLSAQPAGEPSETCDAEDTALWKDGYAAGFNAAKERAAKIADGFTCGICGMDSKAADAIRAMEDE